MNLHEQIEALEASVDRLNEIDKLAQAALAAAAERSQADEAVAAPAPAEPVAPAVEEKPTLRVARPSHNEITLTIGAQSVTLHPEQIGRLIEELANARASMQPEPPVSLPQGWRFAATKNPMMAIKKQANGDRLLLARHTGHGWVPFTFSADAAVELYMMLAQS